MIFNAASARLAMSRSVRLHNVVKNRVSLYAKSAKEEQKIFWDKNAKLNRPLSPHLTIYRLPLTANMSISHRATGAILTGVTYAFGLGALYFTGNFDKVHAFLQENIHPHVMLTLKTLLALPLTYHTLTGIRHLYWDMGRGLKLPQLYKSGYAIIGLALISAFAVASL